MLVPLVLLLLLRTLTELLLVAIVAFVPALGWLALKVTPITAVFRSPPHNHL